MPADEICIVGRKVAEEVVKRSFQKRGTIREHQEIGLPLSVWAPTAPVSFDHWTSRTEYYFGRTE
jgi:hypothetical protein